MCYGDNASDFDLRPALPASGFLIPGDQEERRHV
jgi:hypothetical protein